MLGGPKDNVQRPSKAKHEERTQIGDELDEFNKEQATGWTNAMEIEPTSTLRRLEVNQLNMTGWTDGWSVEASVQWSAAMTIKWRNSVRPVELVLQFACVGALVMKISRRFWRSRPSKPLTTSWTDSASVQWCTQSEDVGVQWLGSRFSVTS